jgi:hypothetical protein
MGPCGLISRLLAFRYRHAFLSFAAPDTADAAGRSLPPTAPGQVTARALHEVYRVKALNKRTRLVGLLAPDANASPLMERGNRWLAAHGYHAVLLPLQCGPEEDVADALDALRTVLPLRGCLLESPTGCATRQDQVGNTLRIARGRESCAFIRDLPGRLRWVLDGQQEAIHGRSSD